MTTERMWCSLLSVGTLSFSSSYQHPLVNWRWLSMSRYIFRCISHRCCLAQLNGRRRRRKKNQRTKRRAFSPLSGISSLEVLTDYMYSIIYIVSLFPLATHAMTHNSGTLVGANKYILKHSQCIHYSYIVWIVVQSMSVHCIVWCYHSSL